MKPGANNERHSRHLARWLAEWKLDGLLRLADADGSPAASSPPAEQGRPIPPAPLPPAEVSDEPDVGEIRLLYPLPGTEAAQRPIYVAVLGKKADGSFLIAPFGRFSLPAVPGEWRTRIRPPPLRVLCVWNARTIPAAAAALSWRAGRLQPGKVRQALELHDHLRSGAALASISDRDIGPPLRHPLDPRLQYQAEEADAIEGFLTAAESWLNRAPLARPQPPVTYDIAPSEWKLAAESRAPYGKRPRRRRKRR